MFVKVDDTVIIVNVSSDTATTFVFMMPLGLDVGLHPIYVSTDGANFRPTGTPLYIEVKLCPIGNWCYADYAMSC